MSRETKDEGVFETYIARKTKSIFTLPMPIIISILCVFLIVFLIFKTDNLFAIDDKDIATINIVHTLDKDTVIDITQAVSTQVQTNANNNQYANTTGPYTGPYKDTNAGRVFNYLKQKGCSDMIACAIMGCISFECGGNPEDYKKYDLKLDADNGGHRGMCQWSYPPYGDRWTNLVKWCKKHNLDPMSPEGQAAYMWEEMTNTKTSSIARLLKDCKQDSPSNTADRLKDMPDNFWESKTMKEAVKAFLWRFEGGVCSPSSPYYEEGLQILYKRVDYAEKCYEVFCGGDKK